jgi:hypothetical protein
MHVLSNKYLTNQNNDNARKYSNFTRRRFSKFKLFFYFYQFVNFVWNITKTDEINYLLQGVPQYMYINIIR